MELEVRGASATSKMKLFVTTVNERKALYAAGFLRDFSKFISEIWLQSIDTESKEECM